MTSIEWVKNGDGSQGRTWNPIVGCSVVSAGCTNCYAMRMAARLERIGQDRYRGLTQASKAGAVWTGKVRLVEEALTIPLRRRKPTTYFVNSMSDLFHEAVPDVWIDRVFAVMALCPQHTFQILTKRSDRMRTYMAEPKRKRIIARAVMDISMLRMREAGSYEGGIKLDHFSGCFKGDGPFPNVWLGVSAEDQRRADERVPDLLATPAAVRWVSAEPLLGPIDFTSIAWPADRPRFPETDDISDGRSALHLVEGAASTGSSSARRVGLLPDGLTTIRCARSATSARQPEQRSSTSKMRGTGRRSRCPSLTACAGRRCRPPAVSSTVSCTMRCREAAMPAEPARKADKPILFSAPMIRALLREAREPGTGKTQTRRVLKPQPVHAQHHYHRGRVVYDGEHRMWCWRDLVLDNIWDFPDSDDRKRLAAAQPYAVGQRLWVKETWCHTGTGVRSVSDSHIASNGHVVYRADDDGSDAGIKWFSSLFLPRRRSRLTLIVEAVRVERLRDISEADAVAEGLIKLPASGRYVVNKGEQYAGLARHTARARLEDLWNGIHGSDAWGQNPWVTAVSFRPVLKNIDAFRRDATEASHGKSLTPMAHHPSTPPAAGRERP